MLAFSRLRALDLSRTSKPDSPVMNAPDMQKITGWLISGGLSVTQPSRMMGELCEYLVQAGLPLWRVGLFVRTLHPDVLGRNFIWRSGAEVETGTVDYDILETPGYKASPLAIVFTQGLEVRGRPGDPDSGRFPIVADMAAEGVTDYVALPIRFIDGSIHASSWTTKQPGGFTDPQLEALKALVPALARVVEITSLRRTSSTLLDTYVGNRAGERILRRADPARTFRDDGRRDMAVGSARLYRAFGPAAGRDRRRYSQSLFRLPGARDPGAWRGSIEVHGRRAARGFPDHGTGRRSAPGLFGGPAGGARIPRQRRSVAVPHWR